MRFITILSFIFLSYGVGASAESDPCKGWKHGALLSEKTPGVDQHSFTIDKDLPYKFASNVYAHEKGQLKDGTAFTIEHRGCHWLGSKGILQYSFSYQLKGKFPAPADTPFWMGKAKDFLRETGVCEKRKEFAYNWCSQIEDRAKNKNVYNVDAEHPYLNGIDVPHSADIDGDGDGLIIVVKTSDQITNLEIVNQIIGTGD
jgi:hypothetical protein